MLFRQDCDSGLRMPMLGYIWPLKTQQLHNTTYFYVCFVYIAFIFSLGSNHTSTALTISQHALLITKYLNFTFFRTEIESRIGF